MSTPWHAPLAASPVDATVEVPGSKSITARALFLAAVADSPSVIRGALDARDTRLFAAALEVMGARVEDEGTGVLRVTPMSLPPRGGRVECGLAGTVMRFLPPLAALSPEETFFDGDEQAYARPLGPLLDALVRMGATVTYHGERGRLPFTIRGPIRTPLGAQAWVDSSSSSQFLSALLLVSPLVGDPLFVSAPGVVPSMPHVEMTLACLAGAGIDLEVVDEGRADLSTWHVFPSRPRGGDITVEPDLSNAGPFLAAALVAGGRVSVPHWPAATTQAGDAWRELLPRLGGEVTLTDGLLTARGTGRLTGIHADLSDVGELAPTVAALAALAGAQGHTSTLTGIAHLRGHETDRLAALATQIRLLGGDAEESDDGLIIRPAPLHGAALRSYADHRMATFAAIIGLSVDGVSLDDVECTSKTLPGFTDLWAAMLATAGEGGSGLATASHREPATPGDGA